MKYRAKVTYIIDTLKADAEMSKRTYVKDAREIYVELDTEEDAEKMEIMNELSEILDRKRALVHRLLEIDEQHANEQ